MVAEPAWEVAVVGGGPAGIAAGTRAAESGRRVVVIDDGPRPGGQIWRGEGPPAARRWLERFRASGATLLAATTVVDALPGRLLLEGSSHSGWLGAPRLVLCTGARELFLPFPGWTLPGVFGVGALQGLLKSGARLEGRRVVLAGSGPLLLPVAASLARAGAELSLVAEQAPRRAVGRFAASLWRRPGKLLEAAVYRWGFRRTPLRAGVWVEAAAGLDRVEEVRLTDGRSRWSLGCDLLGVAYGLVPNLELPRLLGCRTAAGRVVVDEQQGTSVPGVWCAGEPTGIGGAGKAVAEGEVAGLAAAGHRRGWAPAPDPWRDFVASLEEAFRPRQELRWRLRPDTVVCRCEDVPWRALSAGWSRRQAKLYSRLGMGPCQARVCGPALEFLQGKDQDSVRPPVRPARVATLLEPPPGEPPPGAASLRRAPRT